MSYLKYLANINTKRSTVNEHVMLLPNIKQPFFPRVTITNSMFGNLESMDTKATGIDEAPVQAYKYRSCGKNVITNQQDTKELKVLNICQRPKALVYQKSKISSTRKFCCQPPDLIMLIQLQLPL